MLTEVVEVSVRRKNTPRSVPKLKVVKSVVSKPKARVKAFKPKKWKFVKTQLEECDSAFSKEIRERDGNCMFPNCSVSNFDALQCSHYIGRANWPTRFDPDNCIALCWFHHFKSKDLGYEYQKQRAELHGWDGQYTIRMNDILGETRFGELLFRAKQSTISRKTAIINAQQKYGLRQPSALELQ